MKRMTAEMSDDILIQALRRMAPETGSLHCLGCGHEHGCSLHGCAVINRAAERLEQLTVPEPAEITARKPACVFYCNRRCNLDGDWCPEGPGCPRELDSESAMKLLEGKPPNDPLTLEELRGMDGEPVWIERIGDVSHIDSAWALVNREHCLCRTSDGSPAFFELYGKAWRAYRRKPEEGTMWQP